MGLDVRIGLPSFPAENKQLSPSGPSDTGNVIPINDLVETNLFALFDSISDAILILDECKIIACNNIVLEMFACEREQMINRSLGKYLLQEQSDRVVSSETIKQIMNKALEGESQFLESKFTRSDGIVFDAEIILNCLKVREKKILYCIVRDVSKNKREKEFYKALVVNSLVGIYILRDGKFRFVNPKFQEMVGYGYDELVGRKSLSLVHSGDQETARKKAIKMLKMQGPMSMPYELRIITKDGRVKWLLEIVIPVIIDGKREILGNCIDIDDRKKAEEALKTSEERYREILESIEDGYYEIDLQNKVTFFNQAYCKILGFTRKELTGMQISQYVDKENFEKIRNVARKVYKTDQPEKCSDFVIIRKDGFQRHVETSLSLMKDSTGKPVGFRGVARDIDDRKKAEETIIRMAYHDTLTGLPNRSLFNDRLNMAISSAQRNNGSFVVMMLDLDKFKLVNDTLGHDIGDLLLQGVSSRLRALLRKSDTVARMGGDEFMLLLPEIKDEKDAETIARKVIHSFQRAFILKDHELKITASIGIANFPGDGMDFDTLKKNADIAMYNAKRKGRNIFQSYCSSMKQEI